MKCRIVSDVEPSVCFPEAAFSFISLRQKRLAGEPSCCLSQCPAVELPEEVQRRLAILNVGPGVVRLQRFPSRTPGLADIRVSFLDRSNVRKVRPNVFFVYGGQQ